MPKPRAINASISTGCCGGSNTATINLPNPLFFDIEVFDLNISDSGIWGFNAMAVTKIPANAQILITVSGASLAAFDANTVAISGYNASLGGNTLTFLDEIPESETFNISGIWTGSIPPQTDIVLSITGDDVLSNNQSIFTTA